MARELKSEWIGGDVVGPKGGIMLLSWARKELHHGDLTTLADVGSPRSGPNRATRASGLRHSNAKRSIEGDTKGPRCALDQASSAIATTTSQGIQRKAPPERGKWSGPVRELVRDGQKPPID